MATAILSGVRDFTVPRVSNFGQMVGHVVFTIPALASAALYTSCDLMTLGTHDVFIKSTYRHSSLAILPPKSLAEESASVQQRIDECVRDIVFSLIRVVNPAAKLVCSPAYSPQSQSKRFAKHFDGTYLEPRHTSVGRLVPYFCPTRIFSRSN